MTIATDDVRALVEDALRRDAPFATQRERFRQSVVRRAYDRYTGGVSGVTASPEAGETKRIFSSWRVADPRTVQVLLSIRDGMTLIRRA